MSVNYKKYLAGSFSLVLLFVLIIPVFVMAADPLVPCDGVKVKCDFSQFVGLINNIIKWIISIATSIFTISAIYGGFLYMTAGDNPGNKEKAKSILKNTVVGFIIILISWLIVYTIIVNLVDTGQQDSVLKFLKSK